MLGAYSAGADLKTAPKKKISIQQYPAPPVAPPDIPAVTATTYDKNINRPVYNFLMRLEAFQQKQKGYVHGVTKPTYFKGFDLSTFGKPKGRRRLGAGDEEPLGESETGHQGVVKRLLQGKDVF